MEARDPGSVSASPVGNSQQASSPASRPGELDRAAHAPVIAPLPGSEPSPGGGQSVLPLCAALLCLGLTMYNARLGCLSISAVLVLMGLVAIAQRRIRTRGRRGGGREFVGQKATLVGLLWVGTGLVLGTLAWLR